MNINLSDLSDDELETQTLRVATTEQEFTVRLLHHLFEVQCRRLYARRGYSSLWEYTVKVLNYSEGAASHRVGAMRLMFSSEEAKEKIEDGSLHLSSAAAIERFIRKEGREREIPAAEKTAIVQEVAGKSAREAERILLSHAMSAETYRPAENVRAVTESLTELKFTIDAETLRLLERVKELKGNLDLQVLFARSLAAYLERIDPARKVRPKKSLTTSKVKGEGRYVRRKVKQELHERSGGRCEYFDIKTGRRCETRSELEVDHKTPFALGGTTTIENCQLLCQAHNRLKAIDEFGYEKMKPYLRL